MSIKNNLKFKFKNKRTISQGDLWSEVYACAAKAIKNNERFCQGVFEEQIGSNGNIGCASTAIALELNDYSVLEKTFHIKKPKFEVRSGFKYWYFDIGDTDRVHELIAVWLRDNFTKEELEILRYNTASEANYGSYDGYDSAKRIALSLVHFVVIENDNFYLNGIKDEVLLGKAYKKYDYECDKLFKKYGKSIPKKELAKIIEPEYSPQLLKAQKARAAHVKKALLAASKEAKRLGNEPI